MVRTRFKIDPVWVKMVVNVKVALPPLKMDLKDVLARLSSNAEILSSSHKLKFRGVVWIFGWFGGGGGLGGNSFSQKGGKISRSKKELRFYAFNNKNLKLKFSIWTDPNSPLPT